MVDRSRKSARFLTAVFVCCLMSAVPQTATQAQTDTLSAVHAQVARDYPSVRHLSIKEAAGSQNVIYFDVREQKEFAVSRIAGAIRVDPGRWTGSFLREFGKLAQGKTVVFYCSVGVRSSKLAARVQADLLRQGAKAVYNLQGGIFQWHNEDKPLQDEKGATEYVHPYDDEWGRLLRRRKLITYQPHRKVP